MPKTKISEFSSTPANNTDIDSINIAEGCAPSGINDAIRELMAQLKDWQSGTSNDPMVIGSSGSLTLNQGTANGVTYLNGSKVVTSGSALTFDGTNLGIGTSSPSQKLEVAGNMYINTSGNPYLQIKTSGSGNNPYIRMQADTNYWDIQSTFSNTNDDLLFQYNGTALLDLDKNGNLGLGVTPSAWGTFKAMQISYMGIAANGSGSGDASISWNAYNNGTNWIYGYTGGKAARYKLDEGTHSWYVTGTNGTAGNAITFTQAMTLDASGNLGVGTTSPNAKLDIVATTNTIRLGRSTSSYATIDSNSNAGSLNFNADAGNIAGGGSMMFSFAGTERARIDSSGNLLVGTTSGQNSKFVSDGGSGTALWGKCSTSSSATNVLWNSATSGDNQLIYLYTDTAPFLRGSITYNRAGGLVAYNTTSDYRAKTVNGAVQNALSKVALLKPSTGRMNGATEDIDFFVAHELQEVVPSAVTGEKDAVNEDNTPKYQMVDKSALIPLLTAAIQEQQAIIDSLKARLDAANL